MSALVYIQSQLIPILTLATVYIDMRRRLIASINNRLLKRIMLGMMLSLAVDAATWMANGAPGIAGKILVHLCNFVYYAFTGIVSFEWFVYATRRIRGHYGGYPAPAMALISAPIAVFFILLILTPFFGFFYSIDQANFYHRGSVTWIQQAICVAYIFMASATGLVYARRAKIPSIRRECLLIASFIIPPVAMGLLQLAFIGTTLMWHGAVLSVVFLHVNLLHSQAALDGMTGLYNRRSLDERLMKLVGRDYADKGDLFVILVDIDGFKSINDEYGHVEGDRAICFVANRLKYAFSKTDAFISRYGGDEFAVLINHDSESLVKSIVDSLRRPIYNWRPNAPDPLSISAGLVRYDYARPTTPEKLLKLADDGMYKDKQRKKRAAQYSGGNA
ncbi:MAG: GGDEF domain-containing protein [Clostridia bacterium]|nr:GGDEF domain-containing protein [Clostridia bacterium]